MTYLSRIHGAFGRFRARGEAAAAPDRSMELPPIRSFVPGEDPVELVAYYDVFADYYLRCEMQTKRWFVEHVRPDWVIFDVGANVGVYTLLFSRLAARGHVHAFEPTSTAAMLRRNLAHGGAANVTVHETAVGARSGAFEESIYRIWGRAPERQNYPFTTLDDFVEEARIERLDCVKIDVDGFDLEVLEGATRALARFDPWIIIEINHALMTRGRYHDDAWLWLLGQGYGEALVLDHENYILKKAEGRAPGDGERLSLTFDTRPLPPPPA
jgi:FkbM family methyltransferase